MTGESPFKHSLGQHIESKLQQDAKRAEEEKIRNARLATLERAAADHRGSRIEDYLTDADVESCRDFLELMSRQNHKGALKLRPTETTSKQLVKRQLLGLVITVEIIVEEVMPVTFGYEIGIAVPSDHERPRRVNDIEPDFFRSLEIGNYGRTVKDLARNLNSRFFIKNELTVDVFLGIDNRLHTRAGGSIPDNYEVVCGSDTFYHIWSVDGLNSETWNTQAGHLVELPLEHQLLLHANSELVRPDPR